MRVYWLNNVVSVYLVQVSLLLFSKQGLGHFFRYRPFFPLAGLEDCANFTLYAGGKQPMQRQILLMQYKQQANPLLSIDNYTPLVIRRSDENKQLTLLSQRKLGLTARNTLFGLPSMSLIFLRSECWLVLFPELCEDETHLAGLEVE
jgi:hypothetical protein